MAYLKKELCISCHAHRLCVFYYWNNFVSTPRLVTNTEFTYVSVSLRKVIENCILNSSAIFSKITNSIIFYQYIRCGA